MRNQICSTQTSHHVTLVASWVFIIGFGTLSCQTSAPRSAVQSSRSILAAAQIPGYECADGSTAAVFYLAATNVDTIDLELFRLPARPNGTPLRALSASENGTVRLDVCSRTTEAGDELALQRIVGVGIGGRFLIVSVEPGATVRGLERALFNFDYSDLYVDLPYITAVQSDGSSTPSTNRMIIKGLTTNGISAAALVLADRPNANGPIVARGLFAFVGTLEFGDPISAENCRPGTVPEYRRFDLGDAKFHAKTCIGVGTSGTHAYSVHTITLLDPSAHLPNSVRSQKLTIPADAPPAGYAVRYDVRHHNVCDWLVVETPDATYAVSADHRGNGGGTCEAVDPAAPTPLVDGVKYRITYGDGSVVDGQKPGTFCHNVLNWCIDPVNGKVPVAIWVDSSVSLATCGARAQAAVPQTEIFETDNLNHRLVVLAPIAQYSQLLTLACATEVNLEHHSTHAEHGF